MRKVPIGSREEGEGWEEGRGEGWGEGLTKISPSDPPLDQCNDSFTCSHV